MRRKAAPLVLNGLLRGIVLYTFLLLIGFIGLVGQMGLGAGVYHFLAIAIPLTTAGVYVLAHVYRLHTPRRWSPSWWMLYHLTLAGLAALYFVSGVFIYGRTYLWYDVLAGTAFIAAMMLALEVLYLMLSDAPFSARLIALLAGSVMVLGTLSFAL